jgi:Putative peptidoglycan binding domain
VALENVPVGTKIFGGVIAFSLFLALLSDSPPDNDAWTEGEAAAASPYTPTGAGVPDGDDEICDVVEDGDGDPWTTPCTPDDGSTYDYDYDWSPVVTEGGATAAGAAGVAAGLPACDSAAPFPGPGGAVVLPSDLPVPVLASTACRLDTETGDTDAVAWLQRALADCNGEPVAVDGVYGGETRGAVERVQAGHGLTVDGAYGPTTARAMAWPLAGGRASGAGPATGTGCGPAPAPSF